MSIAIDVILVIIFALFVIKFTKDGFIMTLVKIGGKWLSLFVSLVLNPFVKGRLHNWFFLRPITKGVKSTLVDLLESNPNGYNLSEIFSKLPKAFLGLLEHFNISIAALEDEYGSATEASEAILADIAEKIAIPCSETISGMFAYVICFLFSAIFFWWLRRNVKRIMKYSFFRYIDIASGFIIGTVLGLCAVFLLVTVVYTVLQLFVVYDASSPVMGVYSDSYVFKYIKDLDVLGMVKQFF